MRIAVAGLVWGVALATGCGGGGGGGGSTPPDARLDMLAPADAAPVDLGPAVTDGAPPDAAPDTTFDGAPPDASPDAEPDAEPDARAPTPTRHVDVVAEADVALDAETAFHLPMPLGADEALFIEAAGAGDGVYQVVSVRGPSGSLVGEPAGGGLSRTSANPGTATALLPNTDAVPDATTLPAGDYTVVVRALGGGLGHVHLRVLRIAGPAVSLSVVVLLPADLGFERDDPSVETFRSTLASRVGEWFGLAGTVSVRLLPAGAPATLELDSIHGDLSGFGGLGAAVPVDAPAGLRLYLVDQIRDGANTVGGMSGGLPVPSSPSHGPADVTAVRASLLADFPAAVADAAAHELGHALGLYHTTEPYGDRDDPIADTRACPLACDADGDGVLFARECGSHGQGAANCAGTSDNLMFWTAGGTWSTTPGQRRVVSRHPIAGP